MLSMTYPVIRFKNFNASFLLHKKNSSTFRMEILSKGILEVIHNQKSISMKSISTILLALLLTATGALNAQDSKIILNAAQVAKLDVSGKWTGKRNQYSLDKKTFIESFQ